MFQTMLLVCAVGVQGEEKAKVTNPFDFGCEVGKPCGYEVKLEGVESKGPININSLNTQVTEVPRDSWNYTLTLVCENEDDGSNQTQILYKETYTNEAPTQRIPSNYPWSCGIEPTTWYLSFSGEPSPTAPTATLRLQGSLTTCDSLVCASSSTSKEWVPVVIGLTLAAALVLGCLGLIRWRNLQNIKKYGERAPIMDPKVYSG
eukprot:TRINITY_DN2835_c2_g1_i1.p1 TRINITY_DN2835_c2_g1~~TRINITY_DN2835_c2_g1_i1.p1  ORF type:complete len:224 (+),score=36.86 TRINITY_DN2835_c2_g1_i1:61-672(+)